MWRPMNKHLSKNEVRVGNPKSYVFPKDRFSITLIHFIRFCFVPCWEFYFYSKIKPHPWREWKAEFVAVVTKSLALDAISRWRFLCCLEVTRMRNITIKNHSKPCLAQRSPVWNYCELFYVDFNGLKKIVFSKPWLPMFCIPSWLGSSQPQNHVCFLKCAAVRNPATGCRRWHSTAPDKSLPFQKTHSKCMSDYF